MNFKTIFSSIFKRTLDIYQIITTFQTMKSSSSYHSHYFSIFPLKNIPFMINFLWQLQYFNLYVLLLTVSFIPTISDCLSYYVEASLLRLKMFQGYKVMQKMEKRRYGTLSKNLVICTTLQGKSTRNLVWDYLYFILFTLPSKPQRLTVFSTIWGRCIGFRCSIIFTDIIVKHKN